MRLIRHCVWVVLLFAITSCSSTAYYVVRHAEKLNQTDDSQLSDSGLHRAEVLATTLSQKNISRIFVSDRQRTQQTAAPTAALFNVDPIIIPKEETNQLIAELKKVHGHPVLVVRHQEEIHLIVNALSPFDTIGPLPDEFDNLFIVRKRVFLGQTQIRLTRSKYGDP